jgi:EmrB/QacA subfamily drug resistance transporter
MSATSLTQRQRALVTIGLMLALLLAALDSTIVGTALPHIIAELQGLDRYAWVLTAYLVASTLMTPIAGKLGDLFGRKLLLLAGMGGFVLASALCGQARDMDQLIAFRSVQGLFGGTLFATVFASVADIYPPATRARMLGLFSGVFGLASIVGPTLGGYLTDNLSWRWVFYVNLPVGIVALLFVLSTMPSALRTATWRSIDIAGAVALAGSLVPLLIGLSITRDHAWTSPEVLALLGIAAAMGVVLFAVERRQAEAIIPFGLFGERTFAVSLATSFIVGVGMFAAVLFVPLAYQGVLGTTATDSGALLTPLVGGLVVASIVSGQVMTRVPRYRFVGTFGFGLMATGFWLLAQTRPTTDPTEVVRDLIVIGLGIGTTLPLYLSAAQGAVPQRLAGVATSQATFWRNVGATVGVAVLGSILSHQLPQKIQAAASSGLPAQMAMRTGLADTLHGIFSDAAVILAAAIALSLFLSEVRLRAQHAADRVQAPRITGREVLVTVDER